MRHLAIILLSLAATYGMALEVGDQAPAISDTTWIRGEAPDFAKQWTVVEFWATWCPPCRDSIPHLSGLQAKYADQLAIVGLSNEDKATVEPFVTEQGDKMAYRVGLSTPATHEAYMEGVDGIPHAFLVAPDGIVAWHGHPMQIDSVLAKAMAGTLDPAREKQIADLITAMEATFQSQDLAKIAGAAEAVLALAPANANALRVRGIVAGMQGTPEAIIPFFAAIDVASLSAAEANELAWNLLTAEEFANRHLAYALAFANRAVEADPENAATLDTYARARYLVGDLPGAIEYQGKAVELGGDSMQATLDYYQAAAALAAGATPAP
ncbi:MAG: redoxin domain-containing protein [Planctomycetota bacterium]|jgi:thiol-disulfide isomerase/thioredoxin|nr:redoxin domain-containing protein [Planctomycetota bacterium]